MKCPKTSVITMLMCLFKTIQTEWYVMTESTIWIVDLFDAYIYSLVFIIVFIILARWRVCHSHCKCHFAIHQLINSFL